MDLLLLQKVNMATAKKAPIAKRKAQGKPTVASKREVSAEAKLSVYTVSGEKAGSMTAPEFLRAGKVNLRLIAQAIRVYRANQREGSASTKTRGLIEGSTRKIYKQKGTGRARHGSVRAPIFVGGGVVFGPMPRDYSLTMPQEMRRKALQSAFASKFKSEKLLVITGGETMQPKTAIFDQGLKKMKLDGSVLLIVSSMQNPIVRSARNIASVYIQPASLVTTYDVMQYRNIIVMKEAITLLANRFTANN